MGAKFHSHMKQQQKHLIQLTADILQDGADELFLQIKYQEFDTICRQFLEAPQQLDICLPEIMRKAIPPIISDIQNSIISNKHIYSLLYSILDVRGLRQLNRYFPNDAKYLQYTVQLLKIHQQSLNNDNLQQNDNVGIGNMQFAKIDQDISMVQQNYRVSFIILYYLSILVMTPFQINDLNSSGSLQDDIIQLCLSYHKQAPKLGQMANEVLGRFLTRPDCDSILKNVVKQGNDLLSNIISNQLFIQQQKQQDFIMWLQLFSFIVRFAKSSGNFVLVLYDVNMLQHLISASSRELRKITAVLCSRVAQSYLNKQYSWAQQLTQAKDVNLKSVNAEQQNLELLNEIQGFDVPEAFDFYIDGLLCLSEDEEGSVRNIAAQGLASLTGKLPRLFSGEIIDALLDVCGPAGDASGWAGALTALANCAVRKLLSPQQVYNLIEVIKMALSQRFIRGGGVVRDSACLAAWAIARGYHDYFLSLHKQISQLSECQKEQQILEIQILQSIPGLSAALAATAVLSRDLQARRGAGAAFQELAGRIGDPLVPEAIQIAALCDYYALGDIHVCYTQTALEMAKADQIYKNQLLIQLLDTQLQGNNIQERQMAAELMTQLIFSINPNNQQLSRQQTDENSDVCTIIEEELISRINDSENWTQWAGTIQLITLLVKKQDFSCIISKSNVIYQKIIEYVAKPPKSPSQEGQFQVISVLFQCYNTLVQEKKIQLDVTTVVTTLQQIYTFSINFHKTDLAVQNYEKIFDNTLYMTIQLLQDAGFQNFEQISNNKLALVSMIQARSSQQIQQNNEQFIKELYETFKKNLTAQNTEIRLFILRAIEQHIQDIDFSTVNQNYQNLYAIIKRAVNDYALDKRGDVGALVRHRGSIVLRQIVKYLKKDQANHNAQIYNELLSLHQQTIARNCCSKVETLKLLGIRALFEDQQEGIELVNCDINNIMVKYLNLQIRNKSDNAEAQMFDMAELTDYEIKKKLQLEDLLLVNNNYNLLYDVFLNDEKYKRTCFLELLSNFSLYTESDLQQIIQLIKTQNSDYIYDIILQQFDKVTNKGRQNTVQYSCIQAIDQLINHNYEPPITVVSQLIDKIDHYISQELIVFQAYPHAFSIFEFYAYKYDIQLCFDLLVKYLTNQTIKIRDIAFDSILTLFIHKKVADQKIQEISAFDFMLAKPEVVQKQMLILKDLAKKTK